MLRLAAATACLWPAIATAAQWNPTSSDGLSNTAGGSGTLGQVTTGGANTGFGASALVLNQTGRSNTAMGYIALNHNNGSYNTAIGDSAMQFNTTGSHNTATGASALRVGFETHVDRAIRRTRSMREAA